MKVIIGLFLIILSSKSLAAGDAGCGLGSIIIQKNSKLLQLFALTTNHSLFSQELGITFGTSNCSSSGIVIQEKQIEYFIEVNQADITRQMAQGKGEKLETLALLNGCTDEKSQRAFINMTHQSFIKIIPEPKLNASELIANIRSEMKIQNLNHLCTGS